MSRALVVDDSKLARVALKKQLEQYDLSVELADSGEEALEFLKRDKVDVIFMDHVMPGMDGLTAVRALKSNPATATIPVMMYTSKEGELYVSQARALGAVDVLPKQVQPGVLFGMLLKLGLVLDRRHADGEEPPTGGEGEAATTNGRDAAADPPRGMPMSSLLARILEDQRSAMRSDLMTSQRSFATQVATEVHERQQDEIAGIRRDLEEFKPTLIWPLMTGALAIATVFFAALFFNGLSASAGGTSPAGDDTATTLPAVAEASGGSGSIVETSSVDSSAELLQTVAWAISEAGSVPFGSAQLDLQRGLQLQELLNNLAIAGFEGTVQLESHLGEFCLSVDANGIYRPADPEAPISACSLIGHPLDDSTSVSERQTPEFAALLESTRLAFSGVIDVEIIAYDRAGSIPRMAYPTEPGNAGEWNAVAARNNRIEYQLIPD